MKFIETVREGDHLADIYLCKRRTQMTAKNGKIYENVTIQDKTGVLEGKIWDPNSSGIAEFAEGDYIYIMGDVVSYQNNLQLNIKRVKTAGEDEYRPEDYMMASEKNIDEMYRELTALLATVKNPYLKQLIDGYFGDEAFAKAFKGHSAAKTIHHAYLGGLLEHTLSVVKMCDFYAMQYPYLKRDLLLTAAAFHDVGKLRELSDFPQNDYTDDGQLLGHIMIGYELIGYACRKIPGFPKKLASELKHCILAHHGELEYGSPKKPAIPEAFALSLADNADAKLETIREIVKNARDNNGWLGYNHLLETNFRRSTEL